MHEVAMETASLWTELLQGSEYAKDDHSVVLTAGIHIQRVSLVQTGPLINRSGATLLRTCQLKIDSQEQ